MAKAPAILIKEQGQFLDSVAKEPHFRKHFYFTGGTPLSAFYLHHRISEDIDLFSEEEINLLPIRAFIKKISKPLAIKKVDYRQYFGLHTFELYFTGGKILKIDFNYYPFPRLEKGTVYNGLAVDSILDIAVNKVHTISTQSRARDFIDLYFIIKEKGYRLQDLIMKAKLKFDWHIDPIQLGSRLLTAANTTDYPRMLKKINEREWQNFFIEEAKKLKPEIIS